jgi:hypothetical protein
MRSRMLSGLQRSFRMELAFASVLAPTNQQRCGAALRLAAALLISLCLIGPSPAAAQTTISSVSGSVLDQSGAVIAAAEVVLRDLDAGVERRTTSNESGTYAMPALRPGRYSLTVRRDGYQEYVVKEFQLLVNEARTIDVRLGAGRFEEAVTVTVAPSTLRTNDGTISTVIQSKEIVEIPLNGRHFTQLILLAPGATPRQTGQQGLFMISQGAGGISPAVSGARPQMNNFTIDGVDNNMRFTNSFGTSPPPDAIQEFEVATNQSDAHTSLAAGANINLVTKSGTNRLQGVVWEFHRDDALAATNFFDNRNGTRRPDLLQNQYGFFIGGPVYLPKVLDGRQSRTYFSAYYEGFRARRVNSTTASVPDEGLRTGDFSRVLGPVIGTDGLGRPVQANQLFDPLTTRACATCQSGFIRDPFPKNVIPTLRLHPVALAYLSALYPLPNRNEAGRNLVLSQTFRQESSQYGVRVDHNISDTRRVFGRVSRFQTEQRQPGSLPLNPFEQVNNGVNVALDYTQIFQSAFLMHLTGGYNRVGIPYRNVPLGADFLAAVGPDFAHEVPNGYLPTSIALRGSSFNSVTFSNLDLANPDESYQLNADFQNVRGKHELSFGARYMRWRHIVGRQGDTSVDFVQQTSNQPGFSGTGDALASFLLGLPTASFFGFADPLQTFGDVYVGYFGDTWRVTPRLTVNVGLQYVFATPPVEHHDKISLFDYPTALTRPQSDDFGFAYIWAGTNPLTGEASNASRPSIVEPDKNNWAPRVGMAYRLNQATVIRGGFGVFHDYNTNLVQNSVRIAFNNWPYALGQQVSGQNLLVVGPIQPPISLDDPFVTATPTPPTPRNTLSRFNRDPYMLRGNVGVERTLPGSINLAANYVGAAGRNLVLSIVENIAEASVLPANPRRPLPRSGSFVYAPNEGRSSYHALQLTVERRFARGLSFRNAYTWSKSSDHVSDPNNVDDIEYAYDRDASWARADFDVRHQNVFSWVYQLPFGHGQSFGSSWNGFLNQALGGWQVSGVVSIRSGPPFTIFAGQDNANTGTFVPNVMRAQVVSEPVPNGFDQSNERWFDISAFQVPAFGTLGNSGRNALTGPGSKSVDLALAKRFRLVGATQLEFRAEAFNALNHTNFGTPASTVGGGNFGRILGAATARQIQFGVKLHW